MQLDGRIGVPKGQVTLAMVGRGKPLSAGTETPDPPFALRTTSLPQSAELHRALTPSVRGVRAPLDCPVVRVITTLRGAKMKRPCVYGWVAPSYTHARNSLGQTSGGPESVVIRSGSPCRGALAAAGPRSVPAIPLNHGSGRTSAELQRYGPYEEMPRRSAGLRPPWLRILLSVPARRRALH